MTRLLAYEHALLRMAGGWPVAPRKIEPIKQDLLAGFFDSAGDDNE